MLGDATMANEAIPRGQKGITLELTAFNHRLSQTDCLEGDWTFEGKMEEPVKNVTVMSR